MSPLAVLLDDLRDAREAGQRFVRRATDDVRVSVPEVLLERLAEARAAGSAFADAWPSAVLAATAGLATAEAEQWRAALEGTRHAWEAGWDRQTAPRAERALLRLADPDAREPLPAGSDRSCDRCDAPMLGRPANARYCGRACQRAAHGRTALAA